MKKQCVFNRCEQEGCSLASFRKCDARFLSKQVGQSRVGHMLYLSYARMLVRHSGCNLLMGGWA